MKRIVIGMTGATGVLYGVRLLELLAGLDNWEVHLVLSQWAKRNLELEKCKSVEYLRSLVDIMYDHCDMGAAISSGSFEVEGMIVLPCSMKSLSAIANGYDENLLVRAASVMIKERRKLVLCPRETPLSPIHLENMLSLSKIGVVIEPPMPAFYNNPQTIEDIVNHQVMKILDQFGIHISNEKRWAGASYRDFNSL